MFVSETHFAPTPRKLHIDAQDRKSGGALLSDNDCLGVEIMALPVQISSVELGGILSYTSHECTERVSGRILR